MKKLIKKTCLLAFLHPLFLNAIPQNANATTGGVTVTGSGSANLGLNMTSDVNVVEWDSFSIANGEHVTFSKNGSSSNYYVWNKVNGSSISQIDGALTALGKGNIYLFNDSGIVIGAGGCVIANSFVATTLDKVGNFDPTASSMRFLGASSTATVTVAGTINSLVGDVTIIGYKIIESGSITAADSVNLAAGRDVLLQPSSNQRVVINAGTSAGTGTGIDLSGTISGKSAVLVADGNAYSLAINHSGTINATACTSSDGRVMLIADPKSNNKGAVTMSGTIQRNSTAGSGPSVTVIGDTVALTGTASIDMSGTTGGGDITIGQSATYDTDHIHIASGTNLTSSATSTGNGGTVTLWADDSVIDLGTITAKGAGSGNGGTASVTSPGYLGYNGTTDLRGGSTGSAGTLTLTTSASNVGGSANYGSYFAPTSFTHGNIDSTQTTTGLQNTLAYTNVAIVADGTDTTGNLTLSADITWSSGRTLSMNADSVLSINNDITMTGTSSSGTTVVSLTAPTINIGTSAKTHTTSRGIDLTSGDIVTAASTALNIYGGASDSAYARLNTASGTNTITFGANLNLVGGDAPGAHAEIVGTTVNIDGITAGTGDMLVQADDCTQAYVQGTTVNIGQTTEFNDLDLIGGLCSSGNLAYIGNTTAASTIDIDLAGDLTITGGATGTGNHAQIISGGGVGIPVNIDAASITLIGGAGGSANSANISSIGNTGNVVLTTAQDVVITGGVTGTTASTAYIEGDTVTYTVGRDFTINGGGGTLNRAYIHGYSGVTGTIARNHVLNGGTASLSYAEIKTTNGDIILNSSSSASTFSFTGGSSGQTNAAARLYVTGNGDIKIGNTNAPDYIRFTGGSGGTDVYAQALIEGNGDIYVKTDEDIILRGGGTGTYTHAGLKIIGTGDITIVTGRNLTMTTGTSTSSDVFFHAQNGTVTGIVGEDITMTGNCDIPNKAYIQSDSTNGGVSLTSGRHISQTGLAYITVTEPSQLLHLTVGGTHTIRDCSYVHGTKPGGTVLGGTKTNYSNVFLYELFYRLRYFTYFDWYLLHGDDFWDTMNRVSP